MKIFVWGTGRLVGKILGGGGKQISLNRIQGFIDNDKSKKEYMGKRVFSPEELVENEYDAILVANLFSKEIRLQCQEIGIDLERVVFLYNNCILEDINKDYCFIESVIGKEFAELVKKRYHVVRGVEASGNLCLEAGAYENGYQENDYVRIKSFELAVKEIRKRNVPGEVAEVGVFRGEFAQYINYAFPERKCYLFDTFDGFNANEALKEIKNGNCSDAFVEAYKQTNISVVLNKMKYLNNVIIKQGFFPESLDGLEEKFVFVSIDVDFEESIYAALNYFYPRLCGGGYIFVHDYNSSLLGVEKAVDRFEIDYGVNIPKMPLCDANGTLVIMK